MQKCKVKKKHPPFWFCLNFDYTYMRIELDFSNCLFFKICNSLIFLVTQQQGTVKIDLNYPHFRFVDSFFSFWLSAKLGDQYMTSPWDASRWKPHLVPPQLNAPIWSYQLDETPRWITCTHRSLVNPSVRGNRWLSHCQLKLSYMERDDCGMQMYWMASKNQGNMLNIRPEVSETGR